MMPGGFDAVAQRETDYQQRYTVGHAAGPNGQLA